MSNTTEKRPKSLGTMKYNWKLKFSSHQGTQKRDPFSLILTQWQNDSGRFSLHLILCNRFNNSDDLCAGTKLHRKPSNLRINRHIQPREPVSLERSDYEEQQENSEKQNKEKDGILE